MQQLIIATVCVDLCIESSKNSESLLQLWKVLSDMKLSHLVVDIDVIMIGVTHKQQLCTL